MRFTPCDACRRHVRARDAACPFCGSPFVASAPRRRSSGRAGRAALLLGAAAVGVACGTTAPGGGTDASVDAQDDFGAQPAYGAAVDASPFLDATKPDAGDAAVDADDAGDAADDVSIALYGAPPFDSGAGG